MTHSYGSNPTGSPLDEVRLLIGDTNDADWQLNDAEITYYITKFGAGLPAAIQACLALAAKYTRLADEVTGEVEVKFSQRGRNYRLLAEDLQSQQKAHAAPVPFGGGISVSDVATREADIDRIPLKFSSGFQNNEAV